MMPEQRETRYLIVNGDDLGMSLGVNRGIIEAHRNGVLTSASLMVNRPAAQEAATVARELPHLSVGLHLELHRGARADLRAVAHQQLDRFEHLTGHPPTHIDSHRDIHQRPDVLPLVLELARRLGVPVRGHSLVHCVTAFYGQWGGENHPEQVSVDNLIRLLNAEVADSVTELVCHPGYPDGEFDSSYAGMREVEARTLCDPLVPKILARACIRLVGFRDLGGLIIGGSKQVTLHTGLR
jgi:predicted glycoside hydrolase/deacetylase ChbG (UPF0249 family)